MIQIRIDSDRAIPALFFKRVDGTWVDALEGGDISDEARDVVGRIQARAAGGNYAEVGFDLLLLPFYVAGREHFEDLKVRYRQCQTINGTH